MQALAPLGNSIVDNPLIQRRPHTRLQSSHILAYEHCRTVAIWILSTMNYGAWCESKSTSHQSMV